MNYEQLKQPNLSIVGIPEECLAYVTEVFGVPPKYPSATVGWANCIQHTGTPPSLAVPIWFKYNGPDGHVAVWDNGTIYSTSSVGDKTFSSIQQLCTWMGEGMTYLGWSEDINSVKVIGEEMTDKNQISAFIWAFYGRDARPTEIETYGAMPLQETINNILGSQEYLNFYAYRNKVFADAATSDFQPYNGPTLYTKAT